MNKDINKVVVLGGSFNPPTIAHKIILEKAIETVDADLGLFVPSSHLYVQRKMRKQGKESQTLPFDVRQSMLEKMCDGNDKLQVDLSELDDDGRGHTYDTLVKIQNRFKDAKVYFIIGYDTIQKMSRWPSASKLMQSFYFIVFTRNGMNTIEEVSKYEVFAYHKDRFIHTESPAGIENISSTAVRDNIITNNKVARQMVDTKAYEILDKYKSYFTK